MHDAQVQPANSVPDVVMEVEATLPPSQNSGATKDPSSGQDSGATKNKTKEQRQQGKNIGPEPKKKKRKKSKGKGEGAQSADPSKILESVLKKSSFKVPNLSQSIETYFKGKKTRAMLDHEFRNIIYEDTIGNTNCTSDEQITVFPLGFQGHVNIGPSSIVTLSCINAVPKSREKRRRNNKGAQNKKKPQSVEKNPPVKTNGLGRRVLFVKEGPRVQQRHDIDMTLLEQLESEADGV